MEVVFSPASVVDLRATRAYYDEVAVGVSDRFLDALDELMARLMAFPRSAPPVAGYDGVRRALTRGFPFVVFYRVEDSRIVVLRVLHAARSDAEPSP